MSKEARMAEQPAQQEPVAWQYRDANDDGTWSAWLGCDKRLAEDEYRQVRALFTSPHPEPVQQEPVAVVSGYYGGQCVILPIDPARIFNSNTALYTSPQPCPTCEALARTVMLDQTSHDAQRKPLTPLEIENLRDEHLYSVQGVIQGHEAFARAIEAKLKEKNT